MPPEILTLEFSIANRALLDPSNHLLPSKSLGQKPSTRSIHFQRYDTFGYSLRATMPCDVSQLTGEQAMGSIRWN